MYLYTISNVLKGLKYLHKNGLMHRDIKPENILLKSDKLLKIGDFGSTCKVMAGHPYMDYVATRWYRSPECLLTRGRYDTKLDIWAAGCVLYEMTTGQPLFDGVNEIDQMKKIEHILGRPDARLICKFKKHSSYVFDERYKKGATAAVPGAGLQSVYQPFRPAFDVLKVMIVCDPSKRYSADRLLRMPYFLELKNSEYDFKMRMFEDAVIKKNQMDNYTLKKEKVSLYI